jgi:hypothetical protein
MPTALSTIRIVTIPMPGTPAPLIAEAVAAATMITARGSAGPTPYTSAMNITATP